MAIKPKMKAKPAPAKKPAPVAKKPAPKAPAPVAAPTTDEDLEIVFSSAQTEVIVDALLKEFGARTDYAVKSMEESPEVLPELWLQFKKVEQIITGARRAIEDALVVIFTDEDELEGTSKHDGIDGFTITITRKLNRTVDPDKLTALSEEYEIDDEIARMFRFKPELNLAVYRAESEELQQLFDSVITTKPGRPSITITAEE